jgi:hypothetical protein
MSALSIQVPFPVFQGRDGQPLENGYVWIGVANLNPQTNPVVAYFDAALTIPAPQPLRTLNGYISRAGTPAQIYVDGVNFSILVQDSKGSMVYNFPEGTGISADACGVTYNPPFTGAVPYPVCEKLDQSLSVKDFGAVGDGVTDDTLAIQAAINAGAPQGLVIYFPAGVYRTTATVGFTSSNAQQFGLRIVGENNIYTEIKADHSSGPVLALNRSFGTVSDIALTASTARNTGAAGANYGVLMEGPNTLTNNAVASMSLTRVRVIDQPSHGIVHVGNSQLSYYEQVLCQSNKGHGFVFDEGVITGRTDKSTPGLVNLVSCWSLLNTGNGLVIGSSSDVQTPVRFTMYNCEFADNALTPGVRLTADEIWIRGVNIMFDTCAIGSVATSSIGNIRFAGENLFVRNHRSINATHTLRLEQDHLLTTTFGIFIDGLRVVNQVQDPVVIVTDLVNVRDLTANTYGSGGNMTSMFTSGALRAVWNRFPPISIVRKTTNQIVNDSATLVNDSELKINLVSSETVYFEATIRYNSDPAADIKIAFVGPTGTTIRWDNFGSMYVGSGDAVAVSNAEVTEGGIRVFGAAAGVRTINISGYAQVGSTSGDLQMQFAQNLATVANTTVFFNSVLKVFRNNANT